MGKDFFHTIRDLDPIPQGGGGRCDGEIRQLVIGLKSDFVGFQWLKGDRKGARRENLTLFFLFSGFTCL